MTDQHATAMHTLIALLIPTADGVIGDLREQYDPSAKRGLGAHITIRFDWLPPHRVFDGDYASLRAICASTPIS